jgi:hypothetical protein
MDFEFIETLLELPEFRVIGQVLRPRELELHLERRASVPDHIWGRERRYSVEPGEIGLTPVE